MNIVFAAVAMLAGCGMTPAEAVAVARRDCESLPPAVRPYVRYLSLADEPAGSRGTDARVLSGHVNSLSRTSIVQPLALVGNGEILRVVLRDYGIDTHVWESLAKVDPYYHVTLSVEWPGGVWPYAGEGHGKHYPKGAFKTPTTALAPWLSEGPGGPEHLAALVAATQSQCPILRASWFFNQTAAAVDRDPNYYTFLGITNLADYQRLVGVDPKRKRIKVELREAVNKRGVSVQSRAVIRQDGDEGGWLWITLDVRKASGKADPLHIFGRDFDKNWAELDPGDTAQELIGALPNEMVVYGLFNNKGAVQATAPDFIASNGGAHALDRRIHNPANCVECHVDRALQAITPFVRNLNKPPLSLNVADYDLAILTREQYARDLEPFIERDKSQYERAVFRATGMKGKDYHRAYAALWNRTEFLEYDLAGAARDIGVTPDVLKAALERSVIRGALGTDDITRADSVLSSLLNGETIDKTHWQDVFHVAMTAVRIK